MDAKGPISSIEHTDMVTIYINDGDLPFFVHSGALRAFPLVIRQSIKALKYKEKNNFVLLGWMDELTFELCCEFVYTGDLFVPEPFLARFTGYAKPSTSGTVMSPYSGILMAQNYPSSRVQQFPPILWGDIELGVSCDEALPNTHLNEVCNEVLLSHARLYRLALKSGWESLCAAALQRLTIALACSTRSDEHIYRVVELLHLIFDGGTENVDSLHHLLRAYVAWNRSTLEPDPGFQRFLEG
jgi:hypothetical protein